MPFYQLNMILLICLNEKLNKFIISFNSLMIHYELSVH